MIALLLLIGGTSAIIVALTRRHAPAPRPAASAAGRAEPTSTTAPPARRTTSSKPRTNPAPANAALDYSTPTAISVPAIGIQSVLTRLDRNPDGTVQVPTSFHIAGWYRHSVAPGQIGP